MEHRSETDTAWKSYPDRCALASTVCILVGIAPLAGALAWHFLNKPSHSDVPDGFYSYAFCTSAALLYLVAPLLGVVARWGMRRNPVTSSDDKPQDKARIRRAAHRFSVAAPLFVLVGALLLMQDIAWASQPPLLGLWAVGVIVLGLSLRGVACRLVKAGGLGRPRAGAAVTVAVALVLIAAVLAGRGLASYFVQRVTYVRKTPTFSGDSESLPQTLVVPTLDTPCSQGKNIIWCSSFQLAWNEVRDNVIGAPLEVPEAAELAGRLNEARQSASDVESHSVYVAAGRIKDGIIARIERDMAAKFPSHTLPDFNGYAGVPAGILSYSFLRANVPFKYPFLQMDDGLTFIDSSGVGTEVAGFGLWRAYLPAHRRIREQVEVLYSHEAAYTDGAGGLQEYALDLCRHSEPYQVVVAVVERKASLAATLDYVRQQMEEFKTLPYYEEGRRLHGNDVVKVPEMSWRIDHRFKELIGKRVTNADPEMPIIEALQTVEFRLDRSGATLESKATLSILAGPRHFVFDRPFLVYMKKRGAEHPFFVMWVDNAELLTPK